MAIMQDGAHWLVTWTQSTGHAVFFWVYCNFINKIYEQARCVYVCLLKGWGYKGGLAAIEITET